MRAVFYVFIAVLLVNMIGCRSNQVAVLPRSSPLYAPTDTLTAKALPSTSVEPRDSTSEGQPLDSSMIRRPPHTSATTENPLSVYGKPDPGTTAVNIVGAIITGWGISKVVRAASSDASGPWSGVGNLIGVVTGVLIITGGIALLFFQGKNGRVRRMREDRRRARGKN